MLLGHIDKDPLNLTRIRPKSNLNLIVTQQNYHRPLLGTFHAKYCVVDRRIALLNSNNIQDRTNLEQLTHLEGPIVDSFYDMALLSWAEPMSPPMPLIVNPGLRRSNHADSHVDSQVGSHADATPGPGPNADANANANTNAVSDPDKLPLPARAWADAERRIADMKASASSAIPAAPGALDAAHGKPLTDFTLLNLPSPTFVPVISHSPSYQSPPKGPMPIAMACRPPHGSPDEKSISVPQDAAWLSGMRLARQTIRIQTPDLNNAAVGPLLDACRRGVVVTLYVGLGYNDGGEMLPGQGGTNSAVMTKMKRAMREEGRGRYLKAHWYVAKDRERPVDAAEKERNCHVKFMCVDGEVAILGNGNQGLHLMIA
jgi:phosphatidylserine/phosphatidylglycerophosphate/cardiolipin synthase-like enzyme